MDRRVTPPKRVTSPQLHVNRPLSPVQTHTTLLDDWMLHLASVCTTCCMYLKEGNGERYNEHGERKKEKW